MAILFWWLRPDGEHGLRDAILNGIVETIKKNMVRHLSINSQILKMITKYIASIRYGTGRDALAVWIYLSRVKMC